MRASFRGSTAARAIAALLAVTLALPAAAQEPPPVAPADAPPAAEPSPSPPPSPAPAPADAPLTKGDPARKRRGWDDQRRTLRTYPQNLAYNAVGVLTRGNYPPIAAMFAAVPAAMLLDDEWIGFFERNRHETFGDVGATLGGTFVAGGLTIGFFSAGRIVRGGRFRAATYDVSQAILINGLYTFGLKYTIRRERPDASDNLSFPSGHTSNAIAGATVIHRHYGYKLGVPAYGVAAFIGISRMAANRHHFSDVVGGGLLGYGIGRAVVRRNSRPPTPPGGETPPVPDTPSVSLLPDGGPAGDGVGLALSVTF